MNREFSIITINIDKIFKELDNHISQHYSDKNYGYLPYLFMNEDTAKTIEAEIGASHHMIYDTSSLKSAYKKGGVYAEFTGYKVFINNDLRYGVVEIR